MVDLVNNIVDLLLEGPGLVQPYTSQDGAHDSRDDDRESNPACVYFLSLNV